MASVSIRSASGMWANVPIMKVTRSKLCSGNVTVGYRPVAVPTSGIRPVSCPRAASVWNRASRSRRFLTSSTPRRWRYSRYQSER